MVSNGPVLRNSMSKDEFSFSQSSVLGSSEESGSHANFIFGSGRNELQCTQFGRASHVKGRQRSLVVRQLLWRGRTVLPASSSPSGLDLAAVVVAWSPVSHLLDRQNRAVGRRWREAGVAAKQSSGRSSSRLDVAAPSPLCVVKVEDDVIN
nr:hypothetical protein Itr_chr07CG06360 [Ipomoea trifida]